MPVEVRQLNIKTNVRKNEKDSNENALVIPKREKNVLQYEERKLLIQDCIEAVMEILEEKDRR